MSQSRSQFTIRNWMAFVAVSALILTGVRWPVPAGLMAISVLFIMRYRRPAKFMGRMYAIDWISIAALAVLALFAEYFLCFILFFSPGWANGWPFLSFQTVSSVAITGFIALALMIAVVGAGAIVGFICALFGVGQKQGSQFYHKWLRFAAVVILFLSIWIFMSVYASVCKDFPNGYMIQ